MTVTQDGAGRYSGTEFPPFVPPPNSTFNRTDRGEFYRYDASTQSWLPTSSAELPAYNVLSWGAKGGGGVDDTAGIQAALDYVDSVGGGTVYFPYGSYRISSTLLVNRSGTFKTVNLVGAGMLGTVLNWNGSTSQPAIRINGAKQYLLEGILLQNQVAKGTTVGILVQRDSGTGTQGGNCVWRNVRVTDFATGVQVGNSGITQAGSEFHFDHLMLERNTVGCQIQDSNSLDFLFTMLELNANATGLQVLSGGVVAVHGGSASGQTTADFDFAPATSYSIAGFRSEHANRFLVGGTTTSSTPMHISGCTVLAIDNADGIGIRVGGGGKPVVLIGNNLLCKIALSGLPHASSVVIGNSIADTQPVNYATLGGTGAHYVHLGNHRVDTSGLEVGPFADEVGYIAAGVKVPSFVLNTTGQLDLGDGTADVKWKKALIALGGGAAPTVGTIGGSGPAAAGQNSWMRVLDSTGAAFFVPVWK